MYEGHQDGDSDYSPRDYADWREIPSQALERKELRQALSLALASLPSKHQLVFVLRDVQHFTIAETADALGISESAVKTRLLRARLQMRDALAPGMDGKWAAGQRGYRQMKARCRQPAITGSCGQPHIAGDNQEFEKLMNEIQGG